MKTITTSLVFAALIIWGFYDPTGLSYIQAATACCTLAVVILIYQEVRDHGR